MDAYESNHKTTLVQSDREAVRILLSRVRQHRLRHNWSQAEMARRVHLNRATYQNFENGYGNLTLANLVRVLGVLGLTNNLAQLVPPVTEEPTLASLIQPIRQRARARRVQPAKPEGSP
jgi:transcriptional regulator with XRE-family HTH domain